MKSPGARQTGCEIIAALMKGSGTQEEIQQRSGVSKNALYKWLREMVASGLVHRAYGARAHGPSGHLPIVYTLQPTPFAMEDSL